MSLVRRFALVLVFMWLPGCGALPSKPAPATDRLILVSIDALPAPMLGTGAMPTLDRLARDGVHAQWMNPSYPTLTFPNHYTLVTGLRPDHHGIVHNNMRDARLGTYVSKQASARDGRWYGGEPIWATLQKQGGIAATMFWPGSEAEIAGQRPRYFRAFDGSLSPHTRVDQVLAWLDLPAGERPHLSTLYLEQYDIAAHAHGTRSVQAMAALRVIDASLQQLLDGLQARGLRDTTNVIVLSDHGMADVPHGNVSYLDDRLAADAYEVTSWGLLAGIVPAPARRTEVERAFIGRHAHYACWPKTGLPPAWHYGRNPRIPPIICQADAGWRVQSRAHPRQTQAVKGEHGFAPEDVAMRAMFVAAGPAFIPQRTLPAFDNVDVYPLLARLLGVAAARNDGNPAMWVPVLRALPTMAESAHRQTP